MDVSLSNLTPTSHLLNNLLQNVDRKLQTVKKRIKLENKICRIFNSEKICANKVNRKQMYKKGDYRHNENCLYKFNVASSVRGAYLKACFPLSWLLYLTVF